MFPVCSGVECRASFSGCSPTLHFPLMPVPLGAGCSPSRFFSGSLVSHLPPPLVFSPPDCKFTCHPECRHLIQLDCSQQQGRLRDRPSPECTLTPPSDQVGSELGRQAGNGFRRSPGEGGAGIEYCTCAGCWGRLLARWGSQTHILILHPILMCGCVPPPPLRHHQSNSLIPAACLTVQAHSLRPLTFRGQLQVQGVPWASDLPAIGSHNTFLGFD